MMSATNQRPEPIDAEMAMPTWLFWLQLGLSTTLAVLFVVMVIKTRQQSESIRQLQDKLTGIVNSRALDRTTAIEDQLRSTAERLQSLERMAAQMTVLAADNARLRQQLRPLESGNENGAAVEPIAPPPPIKP